MTGFATAVDIDSVADLEVVSAPGWAAPALSEESAGIGERMWEAACMEMKAGDDCSVGSHSHSLG